MRLLFFITFLLLAELSFSQEIFVADSSTGKPIPNVNVVSKNSGNTATTDNAGRFNLSGFSKNDSIKFSHISYTSKILSYSEILLLKNIFLIPSFIEQQEINITGEKYERVNSSKEKIIVNENLKKSYTNIGDILKTNSSLFIKDYGSFSGIKTISSRGMNSENTIVLFNEARVNDIQTGVFDLSTVSSLSVEKIEFQKNSDDESSYSSAGGVLKIFIGNDFKGRKINTGLRLSSDKYKSAFINYSDGSENVHFSINGERSYSPNHYKYFYENRNLKRENAQFNKSFVSGNFVINDNNFILNLYSNYSYLNSGIPGFVVTNNYNSSSASNKSSKYLSVLNTKYIFNDVFDLNGIVSYNKQSLLLNDPDGILINTNDNKESNLSDFAVVLRGDINHNWIQFNTGTEFSSSSLQNFTSFVSSNIIPDMMDRKSGKIFSNIKLNLISPSEFLNNISLTGKINYDLTEEDIGRKINSDNFSYSIGLSILPALETFIKFNAHYGNNTRFPTFNERYYSSLYSHYELNPEIYETFNAGLDIFINFFGETSLSAAYFFIDGNNKIIWIPTRLALQTPRNISRVNTSGIELSLNKKLIEDNLDFTLFYIYTDARNRTRISANDLSYNKQLIYSPAHRFNFNFSAKVSPFSFAVYSSFVSERFYTTDNNRNYLLPEYFLIDFSSSYNFRLFNRSHSFSFTIYNLLDEDYLIIQSYPMPLRTYLITLNLEIL